MSAANPAGALTPDAAPAWLKPLIDNVGRVTSAYRQRLPADAVALFAAANAKAALAGKKRDAAVLVLFSGPGEKGPQHENTHTSGLPDDADLLLTVRASTLRHHAGQAAFPGGVSDPGDVGPVDTALREACEETGLDATRLRPLVTLDRMVIPPSGFRVTPVLAYSPDPGPVSVIDDAETAHVARVPVRAFVNPENRLMVYRAPLGARYAGPAFLLNEMLVWGFTGHVIAAMLDVAGWAVPWDTANVRGLDEAMASLRGGGTSTGGPQRSDLADRTASSEQSNRAIANTDLERRDTGINGDSYGEAQ